MARKKPIQSFSEEQTVFEYERMACRLLRLDPNRMEVTVILLENGTERKIPFAHLPKSLKRKIRPVR